MDRVQERSDRSRRRERERSVVNWSLLELGGRVVRIARARKRRGSDGPCHWYSESWMAGGSARNLVNNTGHVHISERRQARQVAGLGQDGVVFFGARHLSNESAFLGERNFDPIRPESIEQQSLGHVTVSLLANLSFGRLIHQVGALQLSVTTIDSIITLVLQLRIQRMIQHSQQYKAYGKGRGRGELMNQETWRCVGSGVAKAEDGGWTRWGHGLSHCIMACPKRCRQNGLWGMQW
jgi:hypothetical protein